MHVQARLSPERVVLLHATQHLANVTLEPQFLLVVLLPLQEFVPLVALGILDGLLGGGRPPVAPLLQGSPILRREVASCSAPVVPGTSVWPCPARWPPPKPAAGHGSGETAASDGSPEINSFRGANQMPLGINSQHPCRQFRTHAPSPLKYDSLSLRNPRGGQ